MTSSAQLRAAGVALALDETPQGPLLSTRDAGRLEPLAWVVNAAVTGNFPGLRDQLAAGENAITQGLSVFRPPADEDMANEAEAWREASGHAPVNNVYLVGTSFIRENVLIPRDALLEIVNALEQLRGPGA